MKKILLLSLLSLTFAFAILAQQVTVSFQPKNESDKIDSIHATNLTKEQTVKLNSGESLLITPATSSDLIKINDIVEGYLFPNPTDGYTMLSFNTAQNERVYISIYDMSGKILLNKAQSLIQGNHRFQLRFPIAGLYHVTVLTNERLLSYKALYSGSNQKMSEIEYLGSNPITPVKGQLKSAHDEKSLDYSEGDVVHYTVYSGDNTTVISDTPTASITIEVEFYECKDENGNNYPIVKIENQWWMAKNLAYLPKINLSTDGSISESKYYVYGYYGNDVKEARTTDNYAIYGVLYNWIAGINSCPKGWHIPNSSEWPSLMLSLKGRLKETGIKHWQIPNSGATNETGFSGLPGGKRDLDGNFINIGQIGYWWSEENESNPNCAKIRSLHYNSPGVGGGGFGKSQGISVRCVKD